MADESHTRRIKSPLDTMSNTPGGEFLRHIRDQRGTWKPVSGPDSYSYGTPHDQKKRVTPRQTPKLKQRSPSERSTHSPSSADPTSLQEIQSLRYLAEGLSEEGEDLRIEIGDLQLTNERLRSQIADMEQQQAVVASQQQERTREYEAIVPRFEAMKAERSKWQQQIADLKLQLNTLTRDTETHAKSHKELQELRAMVSAANNPKHATMAKFAKMEMALKEAEAANKKLTAERDEATTELKYMKSRLNEWTYYDKEQHAKKPADSAAMTSTAPAPAQAENNTQRSRSSKYEFFGDDRPPAPIKNKSINFGANIGAKGNWFRGKKP